MSRAKIDRTGDIGVNNDGERMTIVRYGNCKDVDIQFDDGVVVEHRTYDHFKNGQIKNPMTPNVYGIGFIGKGRFKPYDGNGKPTKCHKTWLAMMQRCYDPKMQEKYPTYKGCRVCKEWWNFQVFAEWYYSHFYEFGNNERMDLDKDILGKGNKVYSPETCVFVPQFINKLFIKHDKARGDYPVGVCKHKDKFVVRLSKHNERIHLGIFNTPEEAFLAYKKAKEEYIKEVAEEYKGKIDHRAYEAMMNYKVEITD